MGTSSEPHILHTAKGVGYLSLGSMFGYVARFVTAVLLARALGAEGMGMYALGLTAASLFASLAALGLDDAMVRYLAIQRRERDTAGVAGTLQIGLGLSTGVGVLAGIGLYAAADPVAVGLFDEPSLAPLLRAFGFIVPFMCLSNSLLGVARGFKRMDTAALGEEVVQSLVRLVLIGLLTLVGFDVMAAAIVFGIGDVASSLTMLVLLDRQAPLREVFRRGARREVREIVSFAFPLWLVGALRKLRQNLETLLLGTLTAVASVGVYAVASKVNLISHSLYRAIITSVKPNLAELHGAQDREGLRDLYRTATRWALLVNLPFFVVTVVYAEPLLRLFGATFAVGSTALVVLAFGELAHAGTGVCGSVLDMTRHTGAKLVNAVVWLVLLLGGNLLLIPRWGVVGAATASAAATTIVDLMRVWQVWALERVHPYDRTFLKPLAAGAAALAVGMALAGRWTASARPLVLASQIAIVFVVYTAALFALRMAPEDRMVLGRIWGKSRTISLRVGRALRPARVGGRAG
jgi:O-antigen/teichoic acid export membrane protein